MPNGLIERVDAEEVVTVTTSAAAAGSRELVVDWPQLLANGTRLEVADQVLTYTGVDPDTGVVTLAAPLPAAVETQQTVWLLDGNQRVVDVRARGILTDGETPFDALVPTALDLRLPLGVDPYQPSWDVTLTADLRRVVDVPGRRAPLDASTADVDTFPDGIGDGDAGPATPPASSPPVTVLAGPDAAIVRYTPVADAQAHDLYVAQGSLVDQGDGNLVAQPPAGPPQPGHLHTRSAPPGMYVQRYPGGELISLDAESEAAPVAPAYFAIVARNNAEDGTPLEAAPSAWVLGERGKLDADTFRAGLLLSKELISETIETQGITMAGQSWNPVTGFTIPGVVNFPPNDTTAATVTARLIARSLTVLNFLQIQGKQNDISTGSEVVMSTGVTSPPQPVVTSEWPELRQLQAPSGVSPANFRGLAVTADHYFTVYLAGSFLTVYKFLRSTGAYVAAKSVVGALSKGEGGITYNGTHLYVLGQSTQTEGDYRLTRMLPDFSDTPTTVTLGRDNDEKGNRFYDQGRWASNRQMAIGVGTSSQMVIVGMVTVSGSAKTTDASTGNSVPTNNHSSYKLTEIRYDYDDLTRYQRRNLLGGSTVNNPITILQGRPPGYGAAGDLRVLLFPESGEPRTYDYESSSDVVTLNEITAEAFSRAAGRAVYGATVADGYIYSLNSDGVIYLYNRDQLTGQVAVSYLDNDTAGTGKHETALSPTATLSLARGASAYVSIKPVNDNGDSDSPNAINVYSRPGTSGSMRLLGELPAEATFFRMLLHSTTGAVAPTVAQDFSAANVTPAKLRAQAGGFEITGASNGSVGTAGFRDSVVAAARADTGWLQLPLRSGYRNNSTAEPVQYRRINGELKLRGPLSRDSGSFASGTAVVVADLTAGFRPDISVRYGVAQTGQTTLASMLIGSDGTITLTPSAAVNIIHIAPPGVPL